MTAVPERDEQSLTFELPDPGGGPHKWRVDARCVGPSTVHHESYAWSCRFRAQLGERENVSLWRIESDNFNMYWEANRGRLGAFESLFEQAYRGFVRVYRRRFQETLTENQEQDQRCNPGQVFDPPRDGDAIESVAREIEDFLFTLARVREMAEALEQDSNQTFQLPAIDAWERYEPLLADSDDSVAQQLYPKLRAFYHKYEELSGLLGQPHLSSFTNSGRGRVPAIITRLDILGTQAIWAFEDARRSAISQGSVSSTGGSPWPRERAVHLHSLDLENIRRFEKLSLDDLKPPGEEGMGQWILLLGENGTGKTTLLRCIALALIDEDIAQSFVTQFSADAPLVRMQAAPAGSRGEPTSRIAAEIALNLNSPERTVIVSLTSIPGRERLEVKLDPNVRPPVFAYGCRRGNALGGPEREVDFNPLGNVATLFDPQAHLVHAEAWLRKLAFAAEKEPLDRALFEAVLDLLTDRDGTKEDPLLPGVREIEVTPDCTWVLGPGDRRVPLSALSDGYLTTLGWLVDFLARWLEYARRSGYEIRPGFQAEMPAVVLVDELDLHLHPRWQTRVVSALARTFPRTTFVATTHNPLTLNGTVADERMRGAVHIIKERDDGNLEVIQRDLPPGMSADDVLTDEWFDLRSTLDRDTLGLLDEHRALLRQGVAEEHPRRRELEAVLRRRLGSYADTPAERLAQELVAREFPDDVPEVSDLSDEESDRLRKLYEAAVAQARSEGKSPPEQP
jgi:energy-coupling factor transporter ATP-binding protein EcfA2